MSLLTKKSAPKQSKRIYNKKLNSAKRLVKVFAKLDPEEYAKLNVRENIHMGNDKNNRIYISLNFGKELFNKRCFCISVINVLQNNLPAFEITMQLRMVAEPFEHWETIGKEFSYVSTSLLQCENNARAWLKAQRILY